MFRLLMMILQYGELLLILQLILVDIVQCYQNLRGRQLRCNLPILNTNAGDVIKVCLRGEHVAGDSGLPIFAFRPKQPNESNEASSVEIY